MRAGCKCANGLAKLHSDRPEAAVAEERNMLPPFHDRATEDEEGEDAVRDGVGLVAT